jgi:hypothetical protein
MSIQGIGTTNGLAAHLANLTQQQAKIPGTVNAVAQPPADAPMLPVPVLASHTKTGLPGVVDAITTTGPQNFVLPVVTKRPPDEEPAPATPDSYSMKVEPYTGENVEQSTLWGIARAHLDTLLSPEEKQQAKDRNMTPDQQVANFALQDLINLNPGKGLTTETKIDAGITLNFAQPPKNGTNMS